MPYGERQARAIAADYERRGKKMPSHVAREVGNALRGKPTPRKKSSDGAFVRAHR